MSLVVDGLAVYRITRLVVADTFPPVKSAREKIVRWGVAPDRRRVNGWGDVSGHPIAELITCPWCAGFWVAVLATVSRLLWPRLWQPVATAFALSAVAGLGAEIEGKLA